MYLVVSLIPALILGSLTAFIGFILDKISNKQARAIAPVIISLALGFLLILADVVLGVAIESSTASSLFLVLESLVIIILFDRVQEKMPLQRKWLMLVITGGIVYLAQSMLSFFYAIDSYGPPTLSHGNVFLSSFVVFVVYAIPISAATLGMFYFLKRSEDYTDFRQWSFIRLIIVFCGVIFFTPFLFIGGLAAYFFTFLKEARRPIFPIITSLAGAAILAIIGKWLAGTQDASWVNTANGVFLLLISITLIVLALAFTITAFFERKWIMPVLVYGSIFTGIIIELVPVFKTPLICQDLFSFSSLITWFVSASIAFGIIFCILWLEQKRKTLQFRNLQTSQKALLILAILAVFTISLLLIYPIDLNPVPGKTWNHAVSNPPFAPRGQYSLVKWNDTLWIIGGNVKGDYRGSNETWFSRDGITWTKATPHAAFEARYDHSSVVFDNKIWIIGGITAVRNESGMYSNTRKNDVWYSADGITWEPATRSAEFPSSDNTRAVVFDNKIWIYKDSGVWNSINGRNWSPVNSTFVIPMYSKNPVVAKDQMYVVSSGAFDLFWNSQDGITWHKGTTPPFSNENYLINSYANIVVIDNAIWMFRSYNDHKSYQWESDIWKSEDGVKWILVTDSPAYAKGIENFIEFKPIVHNNKILAFMTRTYHDGFSDKYSQKFEIWYSDL